MSSYNCFGRFRTETSHFKKSNAVHTAAKTASASSSAAPPEDEIYHSLNLNFAMHRLFTFPPHFFRQFSFELLHFLAELGFFYVKSGEFLQCKFCDCTISAQQEPELSARDTQSIREKIREMHKDCRLASEDSENVPMGEVASALNFKFEAHRRFSLLQKPDWQHVEPIALAKSGFYYTGDGDQVRCTFCNLEVRGWEAGDAPDEEHKRWNPACPLVKKAPNPFICDIPIGSELDEMKHDSASKGVRTGSNPFGFTIKDLAKLGPNLKLLEAGKIHVTPHSLNIHEMATPSNPRFLTLKSRLDSFQAFWPKSHSQSAVSMARAGFFHSGSGDRVYCFHCNLGLKDWAPGDDPFVQHCKWNSSCQYLVMRQGRHFVDRVLQPKKNARAPSVPHEARGDGDLRCQKCSQATVSKVNLPCGHLTFCKTCSEAKCKACSADILSEITLLGFSEENLEEESHRPSSLTDESVARPKQINRFV